jgi:glycosyltransferase involved in cell wall biosynthesis
LLRLFFRPVDGFLSIGTLNKNYYEALGIEPSKIFFVPYTCDNDRFCRDKLNETEKKAELKKYKNLNPSAPTVLFCAKFIKRKHPELVLSAINNLQRDGKKINLIMAGNGPELDNIKELSKQLKVNNVHFCGFVNQLDLPRLYSTCDLFIHPSEDEPWAIVVNEVMATGLPLIVGKDVGSAKDLVLDGLNGIKLKHLTDECLTEHISYIVFNKKKIKSNEQG